MVVYLCNNLITKILIMKNFSTNKNNELIWKERYAGNDAQTGAFVCGGVIAEPLNREAEFIEFGAVLQVIEYGFLNKDYKVFKSNSAKPECMVSGVELELFDVVLVVDSWGMFRMFAVFLGHYDDSHYLFKYIYSVDGNDSVRNWKPEIKN